MDMQYGTCSQVLILVAPYGQLSNLPTFLKWSLELHFQSLRLISTQHRTAYYLFIFLEADHE